MDAPTLLAQLRAARVDLWIEEGRLRVRAPTGLLTPELRSVIAAHRDALLDLLVAEADEWAMDRLDAVLGDDGRGPEPWTLGLATPRQAVPYGACADCGGPCPAHGMHWCARCRSQGGTTP